MIISYLLVDRIDRFSCLLCRGDKFLYSYLEGFFLREDDRFSRGRTVWKLLMNRDALSINHFSF